MQQYTSHPLSRPRRVLNVWNRLRVTIQRIYGTAERTNVL